MIPPTLLPVVLAIHITLAVCLLLPSLVLPFTLRSKGPSVSHGRFVGGLFRLQRNGSLVIGAGLAITGVGMLLVLGPQLLGQPWLMLALAIYAANLLLAFFVQRPGLRRLIGMSAEMTETERQSWRLRARRQRYVSYAMAAAVGLIAFLMSSKPSL
ncbi:MAG TPA: hypothetical protein VNW68_08135 [Candidatus Limnocylindria bacterium]|nr:hypothetical protein [Candidatus Limnocylindria bacterium]